MALPAPVPPLILKSLDTAFVAPRWGLLRLRTADGLEGFGEFTVEGQLEAAEASVRHLWDYFFNGDARNLKRLSAAAYDQCFYHGGAHFMSALGGLETACWDLLAQAAGLPLYQVLGGAVRPKVKVYRWAGGNNNAPEQAAEEAARVVGEGARAIKMNACPPLAAIDTYGGIDAAVARARAVREAVGPDVDIAFDFHGRADVPMARRLAKALEEVKPLFYEEPVRPDYNRWLPEIAATTHVPIATGERMYTVAEFSDAVAGKGVHILQPDLVHVGGVANTCAVASLAEANGIALAPHCPLSPIAFLACLHVVVQSRAGWILEWSKGIHYNEAGAKAGVDPWLRYVDERDWPLFALDAEGHLALPTAPGLGARVNWGEVEKAAQEWIRWREIPMELADGTPANW